MISFSFILLLLLVAMLTNFSKIRKQSYLEKLWKSIGTNEVWAFRVSRLQLLWAKPLNLPPKWQWSLTTGFSFTSLSLNSFSHNQQVVDHNFSEL